VLFCKYVNEDNKLPFTISPAFAPFSSVPTPKMNNLCHIKTSATRQALHFPIITNSYCKMQSGRSVFKYSYCIFNIYPFFSYSKCVNNFLFKHSMQMGYSFLWDMKPCHIPEDQAPNVLSFCIL